MQQQSIIKKLFIKIKNIIILIFITIIGIIRKIFNIESPNKINNTIKDQIQKKEQPKKDVETSTNITGTLPDEDNIKTNPHQTEENTTTSEEESTNNVILELPKQKYENLKREKKEEKTITIDELLEQLVTEELEDIYKEKKFKVKKASKEIKEKIEEIKERILPKIKKRIENNVFRNQDEIRKEVRVKLEEDLKEHPLFPKIEIIDTKQDTNIYSIAYKKDKEINIKNNSIPTIKKDKPITTIEDKEELATKLDETNIKMVQTVAEIPTPSIENELKNVALATGIATAGIATELLTPDKKKEEKQEKEEKEPNKNEPTQKNKHSEKQDSEDIKTPSTEELEEDKELSDIPKEIITEPQKETEVLEELKKEIEEKIKRIKEEKQQEEDKKEVLINEKEIIALSETGAAVIQESMDEIKKEEFEDKNYDKIERQIDKMLEDISNTFIRYEDKLTAKQKKKLEQEERRLRETKDTIRTQKDKDIANEIEQLSEPITFSEIEGLENELQSIQKQNENEVSNGLLRKMDKLEGMTKEQVANVDKRIMLKRFNKASILLEMTSLLALPFVRNKYFFYFTVGLIVDNHFNFVNAFLNRKMSKYEPADLSQIKKGQDALNGALDITYKNIVELEYLEQQALERYPELIYDPKFVSQVTKLKTQLNSKYNKLMRKNKTMEKYYSKTKKHIKILKPEQQKNANQN